MRRVRTATIRRLVACAVAAVAAAGARAAGERIEIAWPTANPAYAEGRPLADFVQPTESGEVQSGLFGCVRTSGTQFHEALDLKPLARDRRGEATDEIYAVLPGVVRHVSTRAGSSSYGRYVVIEHMEQAPSVHTLYAHLAAIAPGLRVGDRVERAQVIGTMGRSAGGYTIPKDRAHLHFEIGLRLADNFQGWYDWKKFGSRNEHGLWNGMNLVGIDPLEFYTRFRERRVDHFTDYFRQLTPAVRVRVAQAGLPDFIRRYPALRTRDLPIEGVAGWEVAVNRFGVPFAWTPLVAAEVADYGRNEVRVVAVDEAEVKACRCKDLVQRARGRMQPDRDLLSVLQLVFGLR